MTMGMSDIAALRAGKVTSVAHAVLTAVSALQDKEPDLVSLFLGSCEAIAAGKTWETHGGWPVTATDSMLLGIPYAFAQPYDRSQVRVQARRAANAAGVDELTAATAMAVALLVADLVWCDLPTALMRVRQTVMEEVPSALLYRLCVRPEPNGWPSSDDAPSTLQMAIAAAQQSTTVSEAAALILERWDGHTGDPTALAADEPIMDLVATVIAHSHELLPQEDSLDAEATVGHGQLHASELHESSEGDEVLPEEDGAVATAVATVPSEEEESAPGSESVPAPRAARARGPALVLATICAAALNPTYESPEAPLGTPQMERVDAIVSALAGRTH